MQVFRTVLYGIINKPWIYPSRHTSSLAIDEAIKWKPTTKAMVEVKTGLTVGFIGSSEEGYICP